ncbi:sensor histidine kinase [Gaiella sp.]|uniref:sensor histidine kinase n=1 Tax=Gaiella sp. TaxID=2663207 RepID=UPI002C3B5CD9|nr:ATP-binding protein [Gaiella sp.]HWO82069.1 ATP-binding protein [Gaiella sp.]
MERPTFPASSGEAIAEAERAVAWLRLPAIGLIAMGASLDHPDPDRLGFLVTLALFSAWSVGVLAYVHLREAGERFALVATAIDIAAIGMLAVLSGGAYSHARLAFFLVPVAVAFRFRPSITALAVVVTTATYVIQAAAHPAASQPDAVRFIATQAGFLAWVGVACVMLSRLLERRTELASRLVADRARLLTDALEAEQRERKALAESLHDNAIQNLLSARHELEEAAETVTHPALARADDALVAAAGQLREAVFDLHPYVLEAAGLEAALRSIANEAAARGRLRLRLDLHCPDRHDGDQLVFSAARELLSNVVRHADASGVAVRLAEANGDLVLVVEDDGRGFPPGLPDERLADGHIGLAAQRVRIESAGGRMELFSAPGDGTRVEVRVPGTPLRPA